MAEEQSDGRGPYGVIYRRWWQRSDVQALSFEAKAVYAYAKTCPAGGLVGIFPLRPEDLRDELGLGPRRAERALRELEAEHFVRRFRHWVWIVDALATTPGIRLENAKHRAAALKALTLVPDTLAFDCRNLYGLNSEPSLDPDTKPDLYLEHVTVAVAVTGNGEERRQEEGTVGRQGENDGAGALAFRRATR